MSDPAAAPSDHPTPNDEFDELYLAVRRRLLLQCLALTGDLTAARAGVRDAFIAARQQWRRVGGLDQPEAWIRQRAMSASLRHHAPHRRRSESGLDERQRGVLEALGDLREGERRTLILHHLGALDTAVIGRELAITEPTARRRLDAAQDAFAGARGCARERIADELRALAPIVTHPGLPRAPAIHVRARVRTRVQVTLGVVAALAIATLGGLVVNPTGRSAVLAAIDAHPVTASALLTVAQVSTSLPGAGWHETGTSTNTAGTGLHDACQRQRFADVAGAGGWVRQFSDATTGATLSQSTEVSIGDPAARTTYATALNWYADCTQARIQVVSAARLHGVGSEAWLLRLNASTAPAQVLQVVVARRGMITNTLVLTVPAAKPTGLAPAQSLADLGQVMAQNLCRTSAAETCAPASAVQVVASAPPTVETPGIVATVDLPPLAKVQHPWVGTEPVTGGPNLAATACDATTFASATTIARTFVIPGAGLPQSFGLTETVATYPTAGAATAAVAKIRTEMASCHKRQIGTTVNQERVVAASALAPAASIWHEQAQLNAKSQMVTYWMGLSQQGRAVAQITLIPAPAADTTTSDFLALAVRAAQRLTQLP